ncbi:leucine-rich repeat-containing protein 24-like [Sarcoptes scabiei]|nr:leucine-rich repeat-containing protein 24-like [Sarcoptes scabiei]
MIRSNPSGKETSTDLQQKASKIGTKLAETLYFAANEPILACFRIQEHINRTVPSLLIKKAFKMQNNETILKGLLFDIDYTKDSISSLRSSINSFDQIEKSIADTIICLQQYRLGHNTDSSEKISTKLRSRFQKMSLISSSMKETNSTDRIKVSNIDNSNATLESSKTFEDKSDRPQSSMTVDLPFYQKS